MSDNQNDPQEKEVFEDCSDGENNKDTAAPEEEEEEIEEIYNINLHREWLNPLPKDMLVVFLMAFHIHFFSLKTLVWMKY